MTFHGQTVGTRSGLTAILSKETIGLILENGGERQQRCLAGVKRAAARSHPRVGDLTPGDHDARPAILCEQSRFLSSRPTRFRHRPPRVYVATAFSRRRPTPCRDTMSD